MKYYFRIFDTDNNGVISVDELNNIVEHLFHLVPDTQKHHLNTPATVSNSVIRDVRDQIFTLRLRLRELSLKS